MSKREKVARHHRVGDPLQSYYDTIFLTWPTGNAKRKRKTIIEIAIITTLEMHEP
jgi:hypothetical protein